jgi:hypothetical protein
MSLIERLVRFSRGLSEEDPGDLLSALDQAGGFDYLAEEAKRKPNAYLLLLGWALEDQY